MIFHLNPATGVIAPCSETPCVYGRTFNNHEEAEAEKELQHNIRFSGTPESYQYSFDPYLEAAITHGFYRAKPGEELVEKQIELLLHREAVHHVTRAIEYSRSEGVRQRLARTLVWIATEVGKREDIDVRTAYIEHIAPHLRNNATNMVFMETLMSSEKATVAELLATSAELWLYKSSPLHKRAKYLLYVSSEECSGYTPSKVKNRTVYSTLEAAADVGVNPESLPHGVTAFDIETDTTNGVGLRPTKAQITEIALVDSFTSTVFSGDERFILQSFAEYMDEAVEKAENRGEPFILTGWNNHLFDDIFLQTRAEHHHISWNGWLSKTVNHTSFEPSGPTFNAYQLHWGGNVSELNPGTDAIFAGTVDVFQLKTAADIIVGERRSVGLKDYVAAHEGSPVRVERNAMHLLSMEERSKYVLSDGVCTLRAYSLLT